MSNFKLSKREMERATAAFEFQQYLLNMIAENESEAHQIRWHDLRKDPKNLPDTDRYVCVSNGKDWTKAFYSEGRWHIISLVGFTKIILWCDISV